MRQLGAQLGAMPRLSMGLAMFPRKPQAYALGLAMFPNQPQAYAHGACGFDKAPCVSLGLAEFRIWPQA